MRRRHVLGGLAAAAAGFGVQAQGSPRKGAAPEHHWRLLINEAFTGESSIFVLTARYRPFADYMSNQFRERPAIAVEPVVNVTRFLELAQADTKPELVFGKSVNQLAKLVRDHGYQPVVRRADPYKAAFIVAKDSPWASIKITCARRTSSARRLRLRTRRSNSVRSSVVNVSAIWRRILPLVIQWLQATSINPEAT